MCYYDSAEERYFKECEMIYDFDVDFYNTIIDEVEEYNLYDFDEEMNDYIFLGQLVDELRDIIHEFDNIIYLPLESYM
jgi:hypothetical protein